MTSAFPGLEHLAAHAAQVLEVSERIAGAPADPEVSDDDQSRLRDTMQDELGGLRAAIDYVISQNGLDWNVVNRERDRRRALYERR